MMYFISMRNLDFISNNVLHLTCAHQHARRELLGELLQLVHVRVCGIDVVVSARKAGDKDSRFGRMLPHHRIESLRRFSKHHRMRIDPGFDENTLKARADSILIILTTILNIAIRNYADNAYFTRHFPLGVENVREL